MVKIARQAGVSQSTVSRVLSAPERVAPGTRKRVEAIIEESGYVPDARLQGFFRNIHPKKFRTVALVCSPPIHRYMDQQHGFYLRIQRALLNALQAKGCHMLLADTGEGLSADGTPRCVAEGIVDAVIMETSHPAAVEASARLVPTVLFNSVLFVEGVDSVLPDTQQAAEQQVRHLAALGHIHVACFREHPSSGQERLYWDAYEAACKKFGLVLPEEYTAPIHFGFNEHSSAIEAFLHRLMNGSSPPTAILTTDVYAPEICRQVEQNHGLSIPRDMSLTGYDDSDPMLPNGIGLTSCRQNFDEMAAAAVELLFKRHLDPEAPRRTVLVDSLMVERDSTGIPPVSPQAGREARLKKST